jgi:hypothetical protein
MVEERRDHQITVGSPSKKHSFFEGSLWENPTLSAISLSSKNSFHCAFVPKYSFGYEVPFPYPITLW